METIIYHTRGGSENNKFENYKAMQGLLGNAE